MSESSSERAPHRDFATGVRCERERKRLSLSELAKRAGISKSNLSQIEAGNGNPSLETLWALSRALDVSVSHLIEPPSEGAKLVRAGEAPDARSQDADFAVSLLSACPPGARRDIYRIEFSPGRPRRSPAHAWGMIEHVILLSGRARVGSEESSVILEPGDYVTFRGDRPHVYEALSPETTGLVIMEDN